MTESAQIPTPQPPKVKPRLDQFRVWRAGDSKVFHLTLACGVVDRWLAEHDARELECVERAGLVERRLTVCTWCAEQAEGSVVDTVRSVA